MQSCAIIFVNWLKYDFLYTMLFINVMCVFWVLWHSSCDMVLRKRGHFDWENDLKLVGMFWVMWRLYLMGWWHRWRQIFQHIWSDMYAQKPNSKSGDQLHWSGMWHFSVWNVVCLYDVFVSRVGGLGQYHVGFEAADAWFLRPSLWPCPHPSNFLSVSDARGRIRFA